MNNAETTLDLVNENSTVRVTRVCGSGRAKLSMMQMGLTPGASVEILRRAPLADPIEIKVRGARMALRRDECKNIAVVKAE